MSVSANVPSAPPGANIDRWVLRAAGLFILISLALAHWHSPYWLWVSAFVGANLLQSSFTGFCPLAVILRRLGVRPGAAFDPAARPG